MLRPYLILATVATLAACASRTVRPLRPLSGEVAGVGGGTDDVQALVRLALTLDAAGDRRADTLYTADAVVVENARIRLGAPRFAGISNGGGTGVSADGSFARTALGVPPAVAVSGNHVV